MVCTSTPGRAQGGREKGPERGTVITGSRVLSFVPFISLSLSLSFSFSLSLSLLHTHTISLVVRLQPLAKAFLPFGEYLAILAVCAVAWTAGRVRYGAFVGWRRCCQSQLQSQQQSQQRATALSPLSAPATATAATPAAASSPLLHPAETAATSAVVVGAATGVANPVRGGGSSSAHNEQQEQDHGQDHGQWQRQGQSHGQEHGLNDLRRRLAVHEQRLVLAAAQALNFGLGSVVGAASGLLTCTPELPGDRPRLVLDAEVRH